MHKIYKHICVFHDLEMTLECLMVYREDKLFCKTSVTSLSFLLPPSTRNFNYKTVESVTLQEITQNTYMILV